jgi:AraC-like DNA-binding protein
MRRPRPSSALLLTSCGAHGARRVGGFTTGWRSLPVTVVEFSPDGRWRVQTETGADLTTRPGEAFFVPAGVRHCLGVPATVRAMTTVWGYLGVEQAVAEDVLWGAQGGPRLPGAVGRRTVEILLDLQALSTTDPNLATTAHRHRLGMELLELILGCCRPADRPAVHGRARLRSTLQYVETHLAQPFSRTDLAKTVGLSPTRFHTVFHEIMGVAPWQYVLQRRIKAAQELLMSTDLPLEEIAARTGFRCRFYFSRCFHRLVGQPPAAFRRGLHREP